MEQTVYIRLRHRLQVRPRNSIFLKDIAQIIADEQIYVQLRNLKVYEVSEKDRNMIVIDVMKVIRDIVKKIPEVEIQTVGPSQVIVEVVAKKRKISIPLFVLVWLLLFFGAGLTIMNFHEDVSMQIVQQRIYTIMTGEVDSKPLIFQIPYSIGLGAGMILFFNHLFKKRLNEEPSPLEVEMFNYQMDLDSYITLHQNKESMKNIDDH
ncbi:stage V sporulation protein AA [Bacillus sp. DTU_2020_1000418_1_SI_GHA_SEK_038]|uniref:stage V sporulation protein AA n=1 Tax=Bacillus sp. DTU_2020_1000418_1_SI_GHA_SEK_038 TaxID=3077585 RepID=UPI0028E2022C|nr:stage V sporulation protein AA [Bacillus sp. DTU_2020_1000418_1_SI_GHA_SEK_038]WNS74098.1 stage V sporulation protein AA [Bacillus sp. DTU_2020_1000418_1_SI_GHA_SEK_038]